MADDPISIEEGARKYDEQGGAIQIEVNLSEEEDDGADGEEESDRINGGHESEEKGDALMQDFMQDELTKQLIQRDLHLSFNKRELPVPASATAVIENKVDSYKLSPRVRPPSSSRDHQERQRNFLVAQLVDLNENQSESARQHHHQQARQFKNIHSDQDESLLARLMQERSHHNGEDQSVGSKLDFDLSDDSCRRQIGSSSQMDDAQQLRIRQLEMSTEMQRSRSTSSGNSFGDEQLKTRNIDLDEHVKLVDLFGVQIVALTINGKERLCLAQISNTLLKEFSYNEIHNRRVALGITCVQCTPIQLEMLRRAGAMPSSSRRCGMITMREAERLCKSFLAEEQPPELPENFYFTVAHRVNYGCRGRFVPARYISSRAKCVECVTCGDFFSPNKFIFHSHKDSATTDCNPPDSPNINSWRKHINLDLTHEHSQEIKYAWEDVKSLFNGGTRRRTTLSAAFSSCTSDQHQVGSGGLRFNSPDEESVEQKSVGSTQGKGLSRSSTLTSQHRGNQQIKQQATTSNGTSADSVLEDMGRVGEKTTISRMQTLSQNERRKLPIGVWSRDRLKHQAGGEQQIQTVSSLKRSASQSYDNPSHQHYAVKRVPGLNDWQQQQQQHRSAGKPSVASQKVVPMLTERQPQSSSTLYQDSFPHHLDHSMRIQQHIPTSGLTGLSDYKSGVPNAHNQCGRLAAADALAESSKTSADVDDPSISTAGTFLYGQLYSQLMQSQLAHQVDHRTHQMATLEAQMALRQHIWSSLLANLRPQPQHEQTQVDGQIFKHNQLADYCLASSADQQQTNSLLAAAAAAAAAAATSAASTSITKPSCNSFGGLHHSLAHQGSIMEMSQLKSIGLKAPDTTANQLNFYSLSAQANTSDAPSVFNVGDTDNC